ncbi:MAG: tRNA uridine-5-carboxymethylaminomethyl(34) synthesis GTPase MnmE [Treponema sp.]|nr:tRNA uridine-5-carboxymethylaminomethyl(34) synthesis GTPase MnmE [Treponema sp.]
MRGNNSYSDDSPIAAFATTPGGALTLIRCSGKGAIEIAGAVFSPPLASAPANTVIHGWIVSANEKVDEVLVSVFRAPKSYTGEDSLDISCHGGTTAGKAVMSALKTAGFRDALPGEFTFRAFMNGKLDLTKAESVMELVSAKTEISRRRAVSRLSGSLKTEIGEIKKLLVQVLSGAEIYLDYSEDEIGADADEDAGRLPYRNIALEALLRLKKLSASWQIERVYQEGITLVIAGCPNSGKSSLFNAMLKEDRSIVTEIPGTTRDWIEAWVSIEGIPVRLVDTAGLRETGDSVEKIGVERSRKLLEESDIVLYLIDGTQGLTNDDKNFTAKNGRCIFVWNKNDIAPMPDSFNAEGKIPICVSAKTGGGLDGLYTAITSVILQQVLSNNEHEELSAGVGTVRQKNLVDDAICALEESLALAEREEPLDLIAPLLRSAVNSLGEITGEVSTADVLEEMFSRFCVGK